MQTTGRLHYQDFKFYFEANRIEFTLIQLPGYFLKDMLCNQKGGEAFKQWLTEVEEAVTTSSPHKDVEIFPSSEQLKKWWEIIEYLTLSEKGMVEGVDYRIDGSRLYLRMSSAYEQYVQTARWRRMSEVIDKKDLERSIKDDKEIHLGYSKARLNTKRGHDPVWSHILNLPALENKYRIRFRSVNRIP